MRDARRTKTRPETVATLSVVWGAAGHEERLREAERWYRALLEGAGAAISAASDRAPALLESHDSAR